MSRRSVNLTKRSVSLITLFLGRLPKWLTWITIVSALQPHVFQRAESILGRYLVISTDHLVKLIAHCPVEAALHHTTPIEQVIEDLVVKVGIKYGYLCVSHGSI